MRSSPHLSRFITLVLVLFTFTLFTRFYKINSDSLWFDEGFSVRVSALTLQDMMSLNDKHQALHIILLHFWIKIFGKTETAVRSLSAVFNILSFLLIILIGRNLFNKTVTFYTLLIFSLASFQVYFAQEARAYSLMGFLSLASIYFFLEIIRTPKKRYQIGYILSSVLLIFTHIYGWLILFFENIWIIYKYKKNRIQITCQKWLILQTIILILIIPYMFVFIPKVMNLMQNYWLKSPSILHIGGAFLQFSGSIGLLIIFTMLSLYIVVKVFKNRNSKNNEGLIFIILWIIIFIFIPFILSQFTTPIFLPRYAISASFPFYIIIALSIEKLPKKSLQLITLVIIICLSINNLHTYYSKTTREPWKTAIEDLKNKAGSEDLILLGADAGGKNLGKIQLNLIEDNFYIPDVFIYYANGILQKILPVNEAFVKNDSLKQQLINILTNTDNDIWYVASHAVHYENQLVSILQNYLTLRKIYPYPYRDLYGRQVTYLKIYQFSSNSNL